MKKLDGSLPDLGWALYEPARTAELEEVSSEIVDLVGKMPAEWESARDMSYEIAKNKRLFLTSSPNYTIEIVSDNGFFRASAQKGPTERIPCELHDSTAAFISTTRKTLLALGERLLDGLDLPKPKEKDNLAVVGLVYEPWTILGGAIIGERGHRDKLRYPGTAVASFPPFGQPDKKWEMNGREVIQEAGTFLVMGQDPLDSDRERQTPHHFVEAGDERIISMTLLPSDVYGSMVKLAIDGYTFF